MSDTPIEEIQEEPAVATAHAEALDTTIEEAEATIEDDPEEGVSDEDEEEQDEEEQDEEEQAAA